MEADGSTWTAWDHGRRRVRRRWPGIPRTLRGDGRDQPGERIGWPFLRRALQPLREPNPPEWLGRTKAPVSAKADFWRARGSPCHVGGRLRLRCGFDENACGETRRSLSPERHQDVDH